GDEVASGGAARDNKAFVQFHYDVSNDFYALFLDREMVYSCAYFTDWSNGIDQAQRDKLDLICRKLRLKPGERFLDIGCGWGALLCHAAANYGVKAYGVTLSQAQFDFATAKVKRLGLEDRVTIELKDYNLVEGTFDKIASVGMYEHVGTAHYDVYFRKMRKLLAPEGIFLNHGITRRAVNNNIWHDRLVAREAEAVALVGRERYRMWIAYLAGVTGGFERTPLRIYQTVATRPLTRDETPIPPTRADLYAPR
ncbi:MAG: cyclopropane-fatty-acyl-phospholipid synthase, partial [Alphaproteobacteria bacterium]|nr:cyclopropane-fatty-acyl-phospholipid synthase [Alphaproteobacteria bacterium]